LVLLNLILKNVLVYWASIAKIPKGIIHKIRKICFHFLWAGNEEKKSYPLIRWENMAMLEDLGGWGIKNLIWFNKDLTANSRWGFIHNDMLWGRVLSSKYLKGRNKIDWIRQPRKDTQNCSIVRKSLFP